MKYLITAIFLFANIIAGIPHCNAAPHIIEAVGTFDMGDDDSREHAKKKAIEDALRQITEQAGVYVESYSEVNNTMLTRDEVRIIAASIVRVLDENFEFVTDDNWHCKAYVRAEADTDGLDLPTILQGLRHQNAVPENTSQIPVIPQGGTGDGTFNNGIDSSFRGAYANAITGLVIDIRGLLNGDVFLAGNNCSIRSENGEVIYNGRGGNKWLVVHRNRSVDPYFQAGKNPLKIKAIALEQDASGTYSSVIISLTDANHIKALQQQYSFLQPSKILISVQ